MKQHTAKGHWIVEKRTFFFYTNAGQNANWYQIMCKIVTKIPVKPCFKFYLFWKITSEKKRCMLFIFYILRTFTRQRRRWRIVGRYYTWWFYTPDVRKPAIRSNYQELPFFAPKQSFWWQPSMHCKTKWEACAI